MKGKYFVAAGVAIIGFAAYYFLWNKKTTTVPAQPQKENERHHLTNAFSRAKQVAAGR